MMVNRDQTKALVTSVFLLVVASWAVTSAAGCVIFGTLLFWAFIGLLVKFERTELDMPYWLDVLFGVMLVYIAHQTFEPFIIGMSWLVVVMDLAKPYREPEELLGN